MTASDGRRRDSDGGRVDAEPARGDEADSEREEGRFDKYFGYVLDLLSFL